MISTGTLAAHHSSAAFSYDLADRLVSASVGTASETYTYAGDGVRLSAVRGTRPQDVTRFLADRSFGLPQVAIERDGNGKLLRRYSYGLDLVSQTTPTKGPYWYHHDGLGSVSDVTSPGGTSLWWMEYTPFGAARASASTSQAPLNFFRFTGAYLDLASGLYHLRARAYDPATGRFLSTDPLAAPITSPALGSYVYVGNNPVTRVDPSGENPALACLTPLTAPVCAKLTAEAALAGWAAVLAVAALVTELAGDTPAAVSVPVSPSARDNWRAEEQTSLFKGTTRRELEREIKDAGWTLKPGSGRGPHDVFKKKGNPDIKLPCHKDISPGVTRQIRDTLRGGRNAFSIFPTGLGSNVK